MLDANPQTKGSFGQIIRSGPLTKTVISSQQVANALKDAETQWSHWLNVYLKFDFHTES